MLKRSLGQQSQPWARLCSAGAEGPFVIPPRTQGHVFPGGGTFVRVGAWRLPPGCGFSFASSRELRMTPSTEPPCRSPSPPPLRPSVALFVFIVKGKKEFK